MDLLSNLLQNALHRPATRPYPQVSHEPFPLTRGHLDIQIERCTYCGVCEKRCPTGAIQVTRKPAKSWSLQPLQCILCGYCVELCPKHCLFLGQRHLPPTA